MARGLSKNKSGMDMDMDMDTDMEICTAQALVMMGGASGDPQVSLGRGHGVDDGYGAESRWTQADESPLWFRRMGKKDSDARVGDLWTAFANCVVDGMHIELAPEYDMSSRKTSVWNAAARIWRQCGDLVRTIRDAEGERVLLLDTLSLLDELAQRHPSIAGTIPIFVRSSPTSPTTLVNVPS